MIEATRIQAGPLILEGRWVLPDRPPPLPLVVLPPLVAGRDWTGACASEPGFRPWWRMALALADTGVAAFLAQAPADPEAVASASEAAWVRATSHHLASRSRTALLSAGEEACGCLLRLAGALAAHQRPMGMILVAPRLPLEVPSEASALRLHILGTRGEVPAEVEALQGEMARLAALGHEVSGESLGGLTRDLRDASPARSLPPVPHRLLGLRVAGIARNLLRPRWEQGVRPPGTAIG